MERRVVRTAAAAMAAAAVLTGSPAEPETFGIAAHVPAVRIQDEIDAAGIGWVRIDVVWALVEIAPDTYLWEPYDRLIEELESRGLRSYATLSGTPQWATSGSEFNGVPDDPDDWREFCYIVASRYRGRVDAWGFWNEPNLEHFWQGSRTEYVEEILLPGLEAVAAADPRSLLVAPDLAHLSSGHWDDWLERVIDDAGLYLDVLAHHVYPSNGTSGDVTNKLAETPSYPWEPPSVRDVLDDAGWGARPFWLTETGVESDLYTQTGQADFYGGMLERWFGVNRDHDWIDRIFFYEMADPRDDPTLSWGILEEPPGLERKLAFYRYQSFIASALVDDAEITYTELPVFVRNFEILEPVFTIRNTGTTTWAVADGYGLELSVDDLGWQIQIEQLPDDGTLAPGETVTVRASIRTGATTPAAPPRVVPLDARMVRGETDAFGVSPRHLFVLTGRQPPVVAQQPAPVVAPFNGAASFTVLVTAPTDVTYQWRRNTATIVDDHRHAGSRTPQLTVSGIGFDALGDYDCVVTSSAGSVASRPAALTLAGEPIRPLGRRLTADHLSLLERWLDFRSARPSPASSSRQDLPQRPTVHEPERR
jgi:hypothetical protein